MGMIRQDGAAYVGLIFMKTFPRCLYEKTKDGWLLSSSWCQKFVEAHFISEKLCLQFPQVESPC